ncbi:MAG: T9SS type A sorting domain-containing protein, partial [Bacteroidota bacterium]
IGCNGDSTGVALATVDGMTSGYTFLWENGETNATATQLKAGPHSVTITDQFNCQAVVMLSITEAPPLTSKINTIAEISCSGAADASLSASPTGGTQPYQYLWSDGDTLSSIDSLAGGLYALTITDARECVVTDSIIITNPDTLRVMLEQTGADCLSNNGGEATATVTGGVEPYSYAWDNDANGSVAGLLDKGIHTLTLTDANGCSLTDSIRIELNEALTGNVVVDTATNNSETQMATAVVEGGILPYEFNWPDGFASMDSVVVADTTGSFSLRVLDSVGCELVLPFVFETIVSTEDPQHLQQFRIMPNPADHFINVDISWSGRENWELKLLAPHGKILRKWSGNALVWQQQIDLQVLPAGFYFLVLETQNGRSIRKLAVQR